MKIVSVTSLQKIIQAHGLDNFLLDLMKALRRDYKRWEKFTLIPRPSMQVDGGVMELMPICDNEKYFTFKFVNCHPKNPKSGKMTVVATGQLCRIDTGYPVMFSEMTILTALRTAATSALATDLMSRKKAKVIAIIGTGAQSEFQIKALHLVRKIKTVRYFDIDEKAMDKFEKNMKNNGLTLVRCSSAEEAVNGADIVTVITAVRANVEVLKNEWIQKGMHINALGGDTINKTELQKEIVQRAKVVVEYFDQSFVEGEIQKFPEKKARSMVHGELYELINKSKIGRKDSSEITLFDSVGIALEDYSVLRLTYELSEKYHIGQEADMVPTGNYPKDLYSLIKT